MTLPDFKLERFFAKHEFSAEHLLCSSDCESMSIRDLLALEPGSEARFYQTWLGYTESMGAPTLRQAISNIYETVNDEDVLVFTGAEEAIFLFMTSCLTAKDHVIVHSPCYQSLFEVANQVAARVDRWNARAGEGWRLDLGELKNLAQPKTRAIIVNTPHNPTGYLMSHEDWSDLHQFASDRGIIVFCDEVYRESEYDPRDRLTAGCDMSETAISLGVMSKTYGLAGLRIGWVATRNRDVMLSLKSAKDYTTICNSAPSEFLAEVGLRHRQQLIDRNLKIIQQNLELLDELFQEFPNRFAWERPKAGSIAFPKLYAEDADEFCQQVLHEAGVLLAPSSMFQFPEPHFRVGFGRANLRSGIEALRNFLRGSTTGQAG